MEGSFWRCRKGSPPGHCVPDTMFTFVPATCASAGELKPEIQHKVPMHSFSLGRNCRFTRDSYWDLSHQALLLERALCARGRSTRKHVHIAGTRKWKVDLLFQVICEEVSVQTHPKSSESWFIAGLDLPSGCHSTFSTAVLLKINPASDAHGRSQAISSGPTLFGAL
jgi:hypothetical protein